MPEPLGLFGLRALRLWHCCLCCLCLLLACWFTDRAFPQQALAGAGAPRACRPAGSLASAGLCHGLLVHRLGLLLEVPLRVVAFPGRCSCRADLCELQEVPPGGPSPLGVPPGGLPLRSPTVMPQACGRFGLDRGSQGQSTGLVGSLASAQTCLRAHAIAVASRDCHKRGQCGL